MGWKTNAGSGSGSDPTYLEPRVSAVEARVSNIAKIPNKQSWTSTEGQTDFTITNGKITDIKLLNVFIGGVPQDDITLVNETTFRVSEALPVGLNVFAEWFEVEVPIGVAHHSVHELGGSDELDITKLKGYQENIIPLTQSIKKDSTFINVLDFGAKGDGSTDDTVAIQAALDAAKPVNGVVIFPYGKTFMISASLIPYEGITLMGYGSTIKHMANVPKYTRIFDTTKTGFIYSSNVDSRILTIKGFTLDGNYNNQTNPTTGLPWDNDYSLEQNMLIIVGADNTKTGRIKVIIEDCLLKDSTSDGIHVWKNVDILISNVFTSNCWRGGLVASGGYSKIKVVNCHVGGDKYGRGIDMEIDAKGYNDTYRTDIIMSNVECDGTFDIGLQDGAYGFFSNIIQHKPNFSYNGGGNAHAIFENCRFVREGNYNGSPAIYFPSELTFKNCEFVAYKSPDNLNVVTYSCVNILYNTTNSSGVFYTKQRPKFINCKFTVDGKMIGDTFYGVVSSFPDPISYDNVASFENCYSAPDLDRFIHWTSGGNMEIEKLTCDSPQIISVSYPASEHFRLKYRGFMRGNYSYFMRIGKNCTAEDIIELENVQIDESKNLFDSASGNDFTLATIIGSRTILGTNAPVATTPGFIGDIYRLKMPIPKATYEWVSKSNGKNGVIWVISRVLGDIEGMPVKPSGLTSYSVLENAYGVYWTPNTEVTVNGYNVYIGGVFQFKTTTASFFMDNVTPSTSYSIDVTAVDSRGLETEKAHIDVTTLASKTYIVRDRFNRVDATGLGTTETGQTWLYQTTDAAVWQIKDNTAYINEGTGENKAYIDSLVSDNIAIQCTVPLHYLNTRIVFRKSSNSNEWTWGINTTGYYVLQKNVGGGLTTVYTSTKKRTDGDVLRVELRGSEIKCFLNGALEYTQNDTFNQSGTMHGLHVNTNAGERKFDNFVVIAI